MHQPLEAHCHTAVFVAHAGPLEPQAALLAASLHASYVPRNVICRTIEPDDHWGAIGADTAAFLGSLGVALVPAQNPIALDYPHGNKIAALLGIKGRALFLDSDTLLMAPLSWHHMLAADAAAKPADADTFYGGGGSWARVWSLFGRDVPPKTHRASISGEHMRPYFNAGVIAVAEGDAFAHAWAHCARIIDADDAITNTRPWLDQIALPVAFAELGLAVEPLSEAFNFPCHLARIGHVSPYIAHYHDPQVIAGEPKLAFRVTTLLAAYPALAPILMRFAPWQVLLEALAARGHRGV